MSWINEEYQALDQSPRALRRFGLTIGFVILVLSSLFLWRHRGVGWPLVLIGAVFLLVAGLIPMTRKGTHSSWIVFSRVLGWIVTRILLTIVFFLVVTPIGLLQRFFGRRAIEVAFRDNTISYWQERTTSPGPGDYEKQF